jgi:hypothetical protein
VQLPQLKRIRWAVRAALMLGVAASVAANILHARPNPISQTISAWPPLALLLTIELISRVPMHRRSLAALRVLATVAIAGIAAWVSYWHMQGVAFRFGESTDSSYLLPISVDGLIVVASVSLVELGGRIRDAEEARLLAMTAPAVAPVQFVQPAPAVVASLAPAPITPPVFQAPAPDVFATQLASAQLAPTPLSARTGEVELDRTALSDEAISQAPVSPAYAPSAPRPYPAARFTGSQPNGRPAVRPAAATRTVVTSPTTKPTTKPAESATPRQRRPVAETARLADEMEAMESGITEAEIASRLGVSVNRLRDIRRESARVGTSE